jgi:hypothetical protein
MLQCPSYLVTHKCSLSVGIFMKLLAFKRHITFEIPLILLPSVMDTNVSECSRYYSIQSKD